MKKIILSFILLATLSLFAFITIEKNNMVKEKHRFAEVLKHAKAYTIEVAEAMPADKYTFKTTDSVKTFGEQMAHIGMSTEMMVNLFIKGEKMEINPEEGAAMEKKLGASKEECIKLLNHSFDNAIETLNGMSDDDLKTTFEFFFMPEKPKFSKSEGYQFIRDHITHHRGQAIVYLRMQDQKAPMYRAF